MALRAQHPAAGALLDDINSGANGVYGRILDMKSALADIIKTQEEKYKHSSRMRRDVVKRFEDVRAMSPGMKL